MGTSIKRKLISIILLAFSVLLVTSCSERGNDRNSVIRVGTLKGATSIGLVKLMNDNENNASSNKYEFEMASAADELLPKFINGDLDMIAIPANLASVLYQNTDQQVQVIAVNTLGVLYIVEKGNSVTSVSDLKGKTIFATGKGTVPEYTLRYILTKNDIDPDKDVNIEWKSEPAEITAVLSTSNDGIAMLPQPFVTVAKSAVPELRTVLDLTAEWDKSDTDSRLVTGVMIAKKDFIQNNQTLVESFLGEYEDSASYTSTNLKDAAALTEKYGIIKASVAEKAIPYCNIVCIRNLDMKSAVGGYLSVLYTLNPKSVGGALPDEDFYYISK